MISVGEGTKGRSRAGTALRLSLALLILAQAPAPWTGPDLADEAETLEYKVKAAFLYIFAKFVEWPEESFDSPLSPLCIGVIGENPFGDLLGEVIAGKTASGRSIEVRFFDGPASLEPCHVLFVGISEKKVLSEVLDGLVATPVLTVGETERFGRLGGMVRFLLEEGKVRFEVNVGATQSAGLKVSSKLLRVARVVGDAS